MQQVKRASVWQCQHVSWEDEPLEVFLKQHQHCLFMEVVGCWHWFQVIDLINLHWKYWTWLSFCVAVMIILTSQIIQKIPPEQLWNLCASAPSSTPATCKCIITETTIWLPSGPLRPALIPEINVSSLRYAQSSNPSISSATLSVYRERKHW